MDKAIELLDDVALNIMYDPKNKSESDFWEKSAADYFSGLALGLFMDGKEKEVNCVFPDPVDPMTRLWYSLLSTHISFPLLIMF